MTQNLEMRSDAAIRLELKGASRIVDDTTTDVRRQPMGPIGCRPSFHHTKRKPNCIVRPSSALVMVPTVAFEMFASGFPKFA
jgi:hypothetical protein